MDADPFFARLRARQPSTAAKELPPLPAATSLPTIADFTRALTNEGGHSVAATKETAAATLLKIGAKATARSFVAWRTATLEALGLAAALRGAGWQELVYPEDPATARAALDNAFFGIVEADLAIAETGTIGLLADAQRGRLVSCLPRVLIAVLDPQRLVGKIEDVADWLRSRKRMPSSLALVTGPSRTGDIGAQLVVGSHGPAEVHVIVLSKQPL